MSVRPICFMIMPYGTKATSAREGIAAPAKVNFDRLWEAAIEPTIDKLGYDPVRADQDLGALIIHEMIERLAISDLVLADVTIPNGNVYYEVGVRHAAKQQGCVMISADWATPLFDISQMRQIRYSLPTENVDDESAAAIRECLKSSILELASSSSPFYMVLPDFPKVNEKRASAFRSAIDELSTFQGEVKAVRRAPLTERRQLAVDLRQRYFRSGPTRLVVALELIYLLRDCSDWPTTLAFIDQLPSVLRDTPIVLEQRALAQSKAGDHLASIATLEKLIDVDGDSSECRGLMGGRYKELFAASTEPADKARYLDLAIESYERGMHIDLNDYYPSSNLARLYRTRGEEGDDNRALVAAAVTMVACERAWCKHVDDEWLRPTLLGAAFDAGDVQKSAQLSRDVRKEGPDRWKLDITLRDLERSVACHDVDTAAKFRPIVDNLKSLLTPAS
jgi:tetratricopeptide (TPR) repeat protein